MVRLTKQESLYRTLPAWPIFCHYLLTIPGESTGLLTIPAESTGLLQFEA